MATTVIPAKKVEVESEIKILPLDEVAETIRDDALEVVRTLGSPETSKVLRSAGKIRGGGWPPSASCENLAPEERGDRA